MSPNDIQLLVPQANPRVLHGLQHTSREEAETFPSHYITATQHELHRSEGHVCGNAANVLHAGGWYHKTFLWCISFSHEHFLCFLLPSGWNMTYISRYQKPIGLHTVTVFDLCSAPDCCTVWTWTGSLYESGLFHDLACMQSIVYYFILLLFSRLTPYSLCLSILTHFEYQHQTTFWFANISV